MKGQEIKGRIGRINKTPLEHFQDIKELEVTYGSEITVEELLPYKCEMVEKELLYAEKYHNLEEQLGCTLEVLFKALNGVIYYMDDECLEYAVNPYLVKDDKGLAFDIFDLGSWVYLSDYKKTWWLKEDKSE